MRTGDKMRNYILGLAILMATLAFTGTAEAQLFPGTCGPEISGTECMSDWNSDAYNGNESATTKTCPENRDYTSCLTRCECQYVNNKNKCKSDPACQSLALSEKNACIGNCNIDWW